MSLCFSDGRPFTCTSCTYEYRPATEWEDSPRILTRVKINGWETTAMVDTGGVYLVCSLELANLLDLDAADLVKEEEVKLTIPRYGKVKGNLYLVSLTLLSEESQDEDIDMLVTAFVPQPWSTDLPSHPPLATMGLYGCLENIRFAVDPNENKFYFGTIS